MSDAGIARSEDMSVERMTGRYAETYRSFLAGIGAAQVGKPEAQRIDGR
jgi:hypothetical protein